MTCLDNGVDVPQRQVLHGDLDFKGQTCDNLDNTHIKHGGASQEAETRMQCYSLHGCLGHRPCCPCRRGVRSSCRSPAGCGRAPLCSSRAPPPRRADTADGAASVSAPVSRQPARAGCGSTQRPSGNRMDTVSTLLGSCWPRMQGRWASMYLPVCKTRQALSKSHWGSLCWPFWFEDNFLVWADTKTLPSLCMPEFLYRHWDKIAIHYKGK